MLDDGSKKPERLLAFRVGRGRYAIAVEWVLSVKAGPESGGGEAAGGRPRGVPMLDLRELGWGSGEPREKAPPAIVIGRGGEVAELLVDAIEGFVEIGERRALPPLIAPYLRGQFRALVLQPEGELLEVEPEKILAVALRAEGAASGEAREV